MEGIDDSKVFKIIAFCQAVAGLVLFFTIDASFARLGAVILWGLAVFSLYRAYLVKKQ